MLTGVAAAQEVLVTSDIAVSTTWTANNRYNLQQQIYVLPGATLTIQAGTIVASTTNLGGSLAVTRGGRIHVQGTQQNPVIMTSNADFGTWTAGNPRTGTWREAANEWGNLTLMGNGYVSENATVGNTPAPSASNVAVMEGLTAAFPGDTRLLYGGGNDNDDSGTLSYLSIRYTGKVIALNNELNGLSLGGIGRETDIHHVEIMNNVDDGIEIWGGTVNLKYVSVWNIGDDSFDVDQGWRGRAQFGLVVQGHSRDAASGSGVCDNCFEMDGAEQSDWQPVTTSTIYNFTIIGQPDGDHATAWRDNARLQFRNCIFMNIGRRIVQLDNVDGDGGLGYGINGTLSWVNTWTTDYSVTSPVNAPPNPSAFYNVHTSGKLIEIKDSVFYLNLRSDAYTEANARGVFDPGNNNVLATNSPITSITRGPQVLKGGRLIEPVLTLDPRPANDALTSVAFATPGPYLSAAHYRGGFLQGNSWLTGWTATEAFGITPASPWCDLGSALGGTNGDPVMYGTGTWAAGTAVTINLTNARPTSLAIYGIGFSRIDAPIVGGIVVPNPFITLVFFTDGSGNHSFPINVPVAGLPAGTQVFMQYGVSDPMTPFGFALSNAIVGVSP